MSTATRPIPKNRTVYVERTIHILACAACSIDFGIGDDFEKRRRNDHDTFYCPNGHPNHFPQDNEAEKLRKELEAAKRREQMVRDDREWQRAQRLLAERQRAAARGQVTKIKNRVGNGVCPCCNRTFKNLAAHMTGQHPDYAGTPS